AAFDDEDQRHPENDTIRPPAIRTGDRLVGMGKLQEALRSYREYIGEHRAVLMMDGDNAEAKEGVKLGAWRIAVLAYRQSLAGEFEAADELITEALSLAPGWLWMEMVRAHCWMFLGRLEEARTFYSHFDSDRRIGQPSWESVILRDFEELRSVGHSHPLMGEIEQQIAQAGWGKNGPVIGKVAELWRRDES